jgi:putative membrane protein
MLLMKKNQGVFLIAILIIFHMVGLIGIMLPDFKELILSLSFLNLLLAFTVIILAENENKLLLISFLSIAFIIGISVELIGVHTGMLFGDYSYGANLGPKLWGVPLVIGINWGVLSITTASITQKINLPVYFKIIVNAFLLVLFDFVMEPVAMKSDFWSWKNDEIPLFNYVCWFFVALILQLIYHWIRKPKSNKVFNALFVIQLLFFIILNFR